MRRVGAVTTMLLLVFWAGLALAQSNSATPVPYVYRLKIDNCTFDPDNRRQTGFRVQGMVGIVTALHGVVDCRTINAVADNGQEFFNHLVIEQVDIERDIAILVSPELIQKPSDGLAISRLTENEILSTTLSTAGYPLGLDEQDAESNLLVRDLESLDAIIPDAEETNALRLRHSPALTITVLNLQAQLLPGHSGAPLLDRAKHLVGVGNGGLYSGTVNRSWAIPWHDVHLQSVRLTEIKAKLDRLKAQDPSQALFFSRTYPPPTSTPSIAQLRVFEETNNYKVEISIDNPQEQEILINTVKLSYLSSAVVTIPPPPIPPKLGNSNTLDYSKTETYHIQFCQGMPPPAGIQITYAISGPISILDSDNNNLYFISEFTESDMELSGAKGRAKGSYRRSCGVNPQEGKFAIELNTSLEAPKGFTRFFLVIPKYLEQNPIIKMKQASIGDWNPPKNVTFYLPLNDSGHPQFWGVDSQFEASYKSTLSLELITSKSYTITGSKLETDGDFNDKLKFSQAALSGNFLPKTETKDTGLAPEQIITDSVRTDSQSFQFDPGAVTQPGWEHEVDLTESELITDMWELILNP